MGMLDFIAGRDLASVTPLKRQEPRPYSTERGIVASAERIDLKKPETTAGVLTTNRPWSEWQAEAWEYYDAIGEIKYAFGLLGAVMSRVRIYAAVNIDPDAVPASTVAIRRRRAGQSPEETETDVRDKMVLPDDVTDEVMDYMEQLIRDLSSGRGGMPGLLRSFALNIAVAGETYLTKIDGRWQFRSTEEIRIRDADKVALLRTMRSLVSTSSGVMGERELPEDTYIGRIWRAHPRFSGEPDSSMLGLREMCDELLTLQRMVRALARSKMNAGGVFVPDTITAGGSSAGEEIVDEEAEADAFEQEFNQAMIVPATDETSGGTVAPFLMRGPAEDGEKIKYITFDRKTDGELVGRLDRALERILQGIDIPKDVVTGLANVKYCVDDQTEALTREGWKKGHELSDADEVWTINPLTKLGEWQPVLQMNRFDVVDEPMHYFTSRDHNSMTTSGHRWVVHEKNGTLGWRLSSDIGPGETVPLAAPAAHLPTEAKYSDDLVELVAWLYTEGGFSLDRRPKIKGQGLTRRRASIAQSYKANPLHCDRIASVLTRLFGPETLVRSTSEAAMKVNQTGRPEWRRVWNPDRTDFSEFHLNEECVQQFEEFFEPGDKVIKREFFYNLTRAQLELFVQVSSWADGCGKNVLGSVFGQKIEGRQENFELACHLLGYPVSRRGNGDGGDTWYDCRVKTRTKAAPITREGRGKIVSYTGTVWCPTTANGTWFARRGDHTFFTGNSNAINIDESLYKAHVEPMALLLVDSLTAIFLIPGLKAKFPNLKDESLEKIVVWYDPTEVVTKPDPADAAARLHDKFAISDDALRRAHGFSDTDAPDQDEIAGRLAKEKALIPPEVATALIKYLLPDVFKKAQEANVASSATPMPDSARQLLGMDGSPDQVAPDALSEAAPAEGTPGGAAAPGAPDASGSGGQTTDATGGF